MSPGDTRRVDAVGAIARVLASPLTPRTISLPGAPPSSAGEGAGIGLPCRNCLTRHSSRTAPGSTAPSGSHAELRRSPTAPTPALTEKDMMALCPNHHDEANAGALTEIEQRAAKAEPFNCRRGYADGQLVIHQAGQDVVLGGHVFSARTGDLLRVGGQALLRTSLSARALRGVEGVSRQAAES